jgi:hypothetical protein
LEVWYDYFIMKTQKKHSKTVWLIGDVAGWYGTIAIIGAYALISFKIVESGSAVYQLLNFTGAIGVIMMGIIKNVPQSVALNTFWAAIALIALVGIVL